LALVEGSKKGMLADIYTHTGNSVERLTDGRIASDGGDYMKSRREASFPLDVISHMMRFDLNEARASKQGDKESILAFVRSGGIGLKPVATRGLVATLRQAASQLLDDEVATLNATVVARSFAAALPQMAKAKEVELPLGFAALNKSRLTKLSVTQELLPSHAEALLRSLPPMLIELTLMSCGLSYEHAAAIGSYLKVNGSLKELWLGSNQIGDAGAIGLGKALEVNGSLKKLWLIPNKFGESSMSAIRTAWLSKSGRDTSGLDF
jgi:hypothetical protein